MGNVDISNGTVGFFIDGQYVKTSQMKTSATTNSPSISRQPPWQLALIIAYMNSSSRERDARNQRIFAIEPTVGVAGQDWRPDLKLALTADRAR